MGCIGNFLSGCVNDDKISRQDGKIYHLSAGEEILKIFFVVTGVQYKPDEYCDCQGKRAPVA
jgi:hypothetical protein